MLKSPSAYVSSHSLLLSGSKPTTSYSLYPVRQQQQQQQNRLSKPSLNLTRPQPKRGGRYGRPVLKGIQSARCEDFPPLDINTPKGVGESFEFSISDNYDYKNDKYCEKADKENVCVGSNDYSEKGLKKRKGKDHSPRKTKTFHPNEAEAETEEDISETKVITKSISTPPPLRALTPLSAQSRKSLIRLRQQRSVIAFFNSNRQTLSMTVVLFALCSLLALFSYGCFETISSVQFQVNGELFEIDGVNRWNVLDTGRGYKLQNAMNEKHCLSWSSRNIKVTNCNIASAFELKERKLVAGGGTRNWFDKKRQNRTIEGVVANELVGTWGLKFNIESFDRFRYAGESFTTSDEKK